MIYILPDYELFKDLVGRNLENAGIPSQTYRVTRLLVDSFIDIFVKCAVTVQG